MRLKLGQGMVGAAVQEERSILVNDVRTDPRYIAVAPGAQSTLVVPLRHKGKVARRAQPAQQRAERLRRGRRGSILGVFAASVAQALANARLFESEKDYAETMETLAEIGREMSAILDLDELLTRVAHLVKRLIDYRTFGIALVNDATQMIEFKVAIRYGDGSDTVAGARSARACSATPCSTRKSCWCNDVSQDPRYINAVPDARSELVVPLLVKDRCIGAFDLESPELNAFSKRHVELLTLLASQAAVAIENARLWEAVRANEERIEKELRFAQRVQMALLPQELPKRLRTVDVAWRFEPARELGGDLYDFLAPEPNQLIVAVGDVSGKGVPAALYSVFAGEVVRGRTFRKRVTKEQGGPGAMLTSINRILHERQLEEYYCTLCYAQFDLRQHTLTLANSGLPYPDPLLRPTAASARRSSCPECRWARSARPPTRRSIVPANPGDVFAFCSDGISETFSESGAEFGSSRIAEVVLAHRDKPAKEIVEQIFAAMSAFRGHAPQTDDQTALVVKILAK